MTREAIHLGRIPHAPRPVTEAVADLLHMLLAAAWRHRYAIAAPILLLPFLGAAIGYYLPRPYEVRMSVLVQEPDRQNPAFDELAMRTIRLTDRIDALRALVTSRQTLVRVSKEMGLLQPEAGEEEEAAVARALTNAVSMQLIGQEVIQLRYRGRTMEGPAEGIRALESLSIRLIEAVLEPERAAYQQALPFLERSLAEAQAALQEAETELAEFRSRNYAQLPDQLLGNTARLARLREELREREVRLAGAEGEIASIRVRLLRTDPVIGRLEQDISSAMGELALLRAGYTEEHSRVQAARRRLQMLEEERAKHIQATEHATSADLERLWNLAAVTASRGEGAQPFLISQVAAMEQARGRVEQLRSEITSLREAVDELAASIAKAGGVERELRTLERSVAGRADLVQQLSRRYEMARVTADLVREQGSQRVRIVDPAHEPRAPFLPMPLLSAFVGLAAGVVLGIGLAILLDLMVGVARRREELRRLSAVPQSKPFDPSPLHRGKIEHSFAELVGLFAATRAAGRRPDPSRQQAGSP